MIQRYSGVVKMLMDLLPEQPAADDGFDAFLKIKS